MTLKIKAAGLDTRAALKKPLHSNYASVDSQAQANCEKLMPLCREHGYALRLLNEFVYGWFPANSASSCCMCNRILTECDERSLFYAFSTDGADFGLCCAEHQLDTPTELSTAKFALHLSLDVIKSQLLHWQTRQIIDVFLSLKSGGKPYVRRPLASELRSLENAPPGNRAIVYEGGVLRLLRIPFPWKDEIEFAVGGAVALKALEMERTVGDMGGVLFSFPDMTVYRWGKK